MSFAKKAQALFFALRPQQWVKNSFVLLPLIFGKKLDLFPANLKCVAAFLLFCLASGAVYLVNDFLDLSRDRLHPGKRLRPLATGKVNAPEVLTLAVFLGVCSVAGGFWLRDRFGMTVATYLFLNLLYTVVLKKIVILDIFCIGFFFLLRVAAGGWVAEVEISHWLILMTFLLALFLGFNKRRQEISVYGRNALEYRSVLSKYNRYFIDQMIAVITSSVVLAYTLYTVDERTVGEFGSRHLMATVPFVYYGIFRYLYLIHKVHRGGDPSRILLTDWPMKLNLAAWLLVCVAVIYGKF